MTPNSHPAGLLRRLGALFYDGLLLIGVLFIGVAALLPFNDGEALPLDHWYSRAYLVGVCFLFFGWFWTHGGQTLGMRAWKIKLRSTDGAPVTWRQALIRYCAALALCGLGLLWTPFNQKKAALYDLIAKTQLIHLPKSVQK